MKPSRIAFAVLALGFGYSTAAFAQEQMWLKDRRYGEGIGIRTGDLELHPGIAGEFGYDTNYFLRSDRDPPGVRPIDTLRLRITPSFSFGTISQQRREAEGGGGISEPPKVTFRAGVSASYSEFIATKSANSDQLSEQRNVGASGSLGVNILPQRPFGADLYADFLRSAQPSNLAEFNYNRFTTRFGGGILWAPGGGMFDWRLGYQYALTYFEDQRFRNLGNHTHEINTRGRWRFLPRTAFMYDASLGFVRYDYTTTTQLESSPVRARIGINGLVTSSFAFLGMVGWGSSFYKGSPAQSPQQFDSIIAQAEFKWFITPNPGLDPGGVGLTLSSVAVGYTRDFYNSYLGDYYTRDRGYLNLATFFSQRMLLVVDGGVGAIEYPNVYGTNRVLVHTPFTTILVDATLFAEYRFSNTLGLNTTLRYTTNITDTFIGAPPNADYLEWKRFEGFIGLRWFM